MSIISLQISRFANVENNLLYGFGSPITIFLEGKISLSMHKFLMKRIDQQILGGRSW